MNERVEERMALGKGDVLWVRCHSSWFSSDVCSFHNIMGVIRKQRDVYFMCVWLVACMLCVLSFTLVAFKYICTIRIGEPFTMVSTSNSLQQLKRKCICPREKLPRAI